MNLIIVINTNKILLIKIMTNILFSIQLKVNSNILDLEIMEDDTLKTVIDRLCRRGD
jgi:hypothetical protein